MINARRTHTASGLAIFLTLERLDFTKSMRVKAIVLAERSPKCASPKCVCTLRCARRVSRYRPSFAEGTSQKCPRAFERFASNRVATVSGVFEPKERGKPLERSQAFTSPLENVTVTNDTRL